jgi:hypothetical protein
MIWPLSDAISAIATPPTDSGGNDPWTVQTPPRREARNGFCFSICSRPYTGLQAATAISIAILALCTGPDGRSPERDFMLGPSENTAANTTSTASTLAARPIGLLTTELSGRARRPFAVTQCATVVHGPLQRVVRRHWYLLLRRRISLGPCRGWLDLGIGPISAEHEKGPGG